VSALEELLGHLDRTYAARGSYLAALLDAYRAEVLREAAEKQRDAANIAGLLGMTAGQAVRASANLIDPDKQD
jgi:hypothetical protein